MTEEEVAKIRPGGNQVADLECIHIRVLLIEDNRPDVVRVKRLLAQSKTPQFDLTVVERLAAAIPIVQGGYCDVVLLDLSLPDSLGLTSVQELVSAVPHAPIIVLTGLDEEPTAVKAIRHGAQDYLLKGGDDLGLLRRSIRYAIERKAFEARLAERAHFDPLTGLANRALFQERLKHALARAKRTDRRGALMFIDLDRFKAINDTLGHQVGDHVLQLAAEQLRRSVRQSETVARLGGDEFTILLDPVEDMTGTALAAKRILCALEAPLAVCGKEVSVTPSIGIAIFPDQATDPDSLLRYADAAMFRAKSLGRNNFQIYSTLCVLER